MPRFLTKGRGMFKLSIFSMVLFLSKAAYANVASSEMSTSYVFIMKVVTIASRITTLLYSSLADAAYIIYALLLVAMMIYFLYRYLTNTASNILTMFGQVLLILVTYQFAFQSSVFLTYIYEPIMTSLYKMTGYIILIATEVTPHQGNSIGASNYLNTAFMQSDYVLDSMIRAYEKITQHDAYNGDSWMERLFDKLGEWILLGLMNLLKVYFAIVFSIAIASAHILLAIAPFAIVFAAYAQTRWIFGSVTRGFFKFALTPIFAAIAMGVILYVFQDLLNVAELFLDTENPEHPPENFTAPSLIAVIFGFYLMSKSSEFASMMTQGGGGAVSDLFGHGVSMSMGYGAASIRPLKNWGQSAGMGGAKLAGKGAVSGYSSAAKFFTKSPLSKASDLGVR